MTNVERLGDIRRGILDDDFLAVARRIRAIFWLSGKRRVSECVHLSKNLTNQILCVETEVKKGFIVDDGLYPLVRLELKI